MNEIGLKHHLDSIQHQSLMHAAYKDDLSINSIGNSKQAILKAFQKLQNENDELDAYYSKTIIEKDEEIAWLMNELFDLKNPPIVIRNSTKMKRMKENTSVALYELDLLHKKVNPRRNGNIDNHFKHIKRWLKDE